MNVVECVNVHKEFEIGDIPLSVLSGVSMRVESGEFVAVVGKSGSGKSTLLNIIGLLDTVTGGEIIIDNVGINTLSDSQRAILRNKRIGFIFQSFYLEPSYEVYKNVEIPLIIGNTPKRERKIRIDECLRKVGMYDKYKAYTHTLSGGEKQRVCIARALANNPRLILADEPCGNLDSVNTEVIMQIFMKLKNEGNTVIMVTHSHEEAAWAERTITLKDGCICQWQTKIT
ncbi:MAG: ABC transporter ATP-binding protein [Lachnospiraceae bacterium]|jgi:putative ABC transport system ATP-binding protein|nr:ABC transporter ATP-binding protein [Lachnospiraceae bacterium]